MSGKPIDELGNRYGRLIVLKRNGSSKSGVALWLCQCDCGNTTTVRGTHLRSKVTRSCGCYAGDRASAANLRDFSHVGPSAIYSVYKRSAKDRGLFFNLSLEEVADLIQQPCFYCGSPPSNIHTYTGRRDGDIIIAYSGLDRVDNQKGYITENVVPCCKVCNIAKNNTNVKEFLSWIRRVYKYSFREENKT